MREKIKIIQNNAVNNEIDKYIFRKILSMFFL